MIFQTGVLPSHNTNNIEIHTTPKNIEQNIEFIELKCIIDLCG